MNWTGGTLQRTKHANKGINQKQKAYFARARTHLQNGSKSPAVPFRPSYLQNDDSFELAGHLPSFGPGSVRHTGHPARNRHDTTHRGLLPNSEHRGSTHGNGAKARHSPPAASVRTDALTLQPLRGSGDKTPGKRKAVDADLEAQLLEANKKRLLKQCDWTGAAPFRPVNLRFASSKEKRRVGKRREVGGQHGATARRVEHTHHIMPRNQPMNDHLATAFVSGALQDHPHHIRVRIGTDASTTTCPIQRNDYAQSHASSDPMLFEQSNGDVGRPDSQGAVQLAPVNVHPYDNTYNDHQQATTNKQARMHKQTQSYASPSGHYETYNDNGRNRRVPSFSGGEHTGPVSSKSYPDAKRRGPPTGSSSPSVRITQQVKGTEHPLRLVFESSTAPGLVRGRDILQRRDDCGTEQALEMDDAVAPQSRTMHLDSVPELLAGSEAIAATAIVDEKPWKSLLNIPDQSSSHTTISDNSTKSVVHNHPTSRVREAESTSWSQRATEGDQTHLSSSVISASLPSLKRHTQSRVDAPAHGSKTGLDHRNNPTLQMHEEDERLWQNFVFGSDEESSSETTQQHGDDGGQRSWKASSGYLPLSLAVSSVTSTPARPLSDRAVREVVHDNARTAPSAVSRMISIAGAVSRDFEALIDDEDTRLAQRSAIGEHSVIHASMLNNASCDPDSVSSRRISLAETSRSGLDHAQRATDRISEQVQTNSNEALHHFRHSSTYDSAGSFSEGLDLIDAEARA